MLKLNTVSLALKASAINIRAYAWLSIQYPSEVLRLWDKGGKVNGSVKLMILLTRSSGWKRIAIYGKTRLS